MLIVTGTVQGRTLGPAQDTRSAQADRLPAAAKCSPDSLETGASGQPARPAGESSICAFLPAANIQLSVTH